MTRARAHPFDVVRDFETELCEYTHAPYAVAVNSCTSALMLAVAFCIKDLAGAAYKPLISIPRPGYITVPQAIIHAGGRPGWRDEEWSGAYQLAPLPVWDSARRFTGGMFRPGQMQCVSFHASKILALEMGGAILHDDPEADRWLRRARFDGRTERVHPRDDVFDMIGYHVYMPPSVAAHGLLRLYSLPLVNADLPNDDEPDLSRLEIFQ